MRKFLFTVTLLLIMPQIHADSPEGYPFVSFDKAMALSRTSNKPVFVYFGRYGCGYCEKTNKEAFSDQGVKKTYVENYILAYVDSESGKRLRLPSGERITERELGTRYKAFVTPIFSFLSADGDVLHRMIGVQRVEDLMSAHKKIQEIIAKRDGAS